MNIDKQEDSVIVDATVRIGSTSSTTDGIGRLLVSDDSNHPVVAPPDVGGASSSPREEIVGGRPTAIFDDNGNAVEGGNSGGDDDDIVDDFVVDDEDDVIKDDDGDDDDDDESNYSYAYDDEEEGHYSGFLIPTDQFEVVAPPLPPPVNVVVAEDFAAAAAATNGFGGEEGGTGCRSSSGTDTRSMARGDDRRPIPPPQPVVPETRPREEERKQKWREPTRAAVNMSLRAEKEKTGGRRRLASDLYKIMSADTQEAGFSLQPCDEDSMERWCIKLFGFDEDSNLAKDLMVCGMDHVELEMSFPDQYPFEPPFVRVVKPRFKRQTGFVMSGALCMELLTKDGWNPINDIESVIVSIRSLMVVGDGRLQAAVDMPEADYARILKSSLEKSKLLGGGECTNEATEFDEEEFGDAKAGEAKRKRESNNDADGSDSKSKASGAVRKPTGGSYTTAEAQSAYDHLSKYHKQEGWDKSGWWSRKG
jgi:ubiquitin-conjugating enzyme E2 Q